MNPFRLLPRMFYRVVFFVLLPFLLLFLWQDDPDAVTECAQAGDVAEIRDCASDLEFERFGRKALGNVEHLKNLGK